MNTYIISLHHFKYCTASFFICVDAANEAVYELVAEPVQEPQAEEQQEETVEPAPEEVVNPAELQGKPRSITFTLNLHSVLIMYLCIKFLGVVWNPSCTIPRLLQCLY